METIVSTAIGIALVLGLSGIKIDREYERGVTASGRGAGREGQGGSWNRACTPPQLKRPRRTGLDTHVPLCSTTEGKGLLPLLRSPLPPCVFGHLSIRATTWRQGTRNVLDYALYRPKSSS